MAEPTVRIVCVLAMPRTGTRQLARLFRRVEGFESFGEIFNPAKSYTLRASHLRALGDRLGAELVPDRADEHTIAAVRANPGAVLDVLAERAAPNIVATKLFPGHLERPLVGEHVVHRGDVVPIILRRRVIDCYASRLKAKAVNAWWGHDTTDVEVHADIENFARWIIGPQRWYRWCRDAIEQAGRPVHLMTFETDIEPGSQHTRTFIEQALRAHGLELDAPPHKIHRERRQDTNEHPADRIANWPDFERELERRDLLDLANGYFI
ncbi:MAG: hypothetical protein OES57_02490 [Acidimicrobiia bacterium]|nr:hypothetical protein [Acidimicrobiia bacterium]